MLISIVWKRTFQVVWWLLKKPLLFCKLVWWFLRSLSSDSPCQLDVLGHDGDSLGVDGT